MSARPSDEARCEGAHLHPMALPDLPAVVALEQQVYSHPWSRGNFIDSMAAGHDMQVLVDADGLLGYAVAMWAVDEVHLLNITVAPRVQGRGHARHLLDALRERALDRGMVTLWLEVRLSNARAQQIYARYGFRQVAVRKGYYPLDTRRREDALVMSLPLVAGPGAGP
jgi:[ribosomal protein S18]-alanine N-acetyltransferase